MNEDIKDQIDLCKTALRKAMGHLARLEQLIKARSPTSTMSEEIEELR